MFGGFPHGPNRVGIPYGKPHVVAYGCYRFAWRGCRNGTQVPAVQYADIVRPLPRGCRGVFAYGCGKVEQVAFADVTHGTLRGRGCGAGNRPVGFHSTCGKPHCNAGNPQSGDSAETRTRRAGSCGCQQKFCGSPQASREIRNRACMRAGNTSRAYAPGIIPRAIGPNPVQGKELRRFA